MNFGYKALADNSMERRQKGLVCSNRKINGIVNGLVLYYQAITCKIVDRKCLTSKIKHLYNQFGESLRSIHDLDLTGA